MLPILTFYREILVVLLGYNSLSQLLEKVDEVMNHLKSEQTKKRLEYLSHNLNIQTLNEVVVLSNCDTLITVFNMSVKDLLKPNIYKVEH